MTYNEALGIVSKLFFPDPERISIVSPEDRQEVYAIIRQALEAQSND